MTHTPPVPPGNTSPYPIQEPAHSAVATAAPVHEPSGKSSWSIGRIVGAAAGVGAIAIGVAAVLFPRETAAEKPKTAAKAGKSAKAGKKA